MGTGHGEMVVELDDCKRSRNCPAANTNSCNEMAAAAAAAGLRETESLRTAASEDSAPLSSQGEFRQSSRSSLFITLTLRPGPH
ncbi:hypothetical protein GUJ93_ZPchr0006g45316 [Zizania palustris]|uniref:Uncharacterized protein n=1 Tax=Zizania palustris TaxID=103762 RepID=A0A8J5SP07_ZIZPA|nr:hypothetical protein GUJ93_ZPchr0006g45316 [Zizania palustris]